MANRKLLLCLFFVYLAVNFIECKYGGGRSSSRSHSSGSRSWGSSSGYKPSSSSSWHSSASKPSSSYGTHSYPSSHSGLSGSSSGSHGYPSSSSGLSGSGSSSHGYPSSSTGLSGSKSGSSSYPSSYSGLSGSGTGSHGYPSSGSGTSGINHGYPSSSGSGSSLSGSGSRPPSTGTHTYPSSPSGMSGSGHNSGTYNPYSTQHGGSWSNSGNYKPSYGTSYHPSQTYHTNTGYVPGSHSYGYGSHGTHYVPPIYHTSPQYVYVNEYRNSGSRYGDILTGLALYDLGRSHSHYHHHYYNDDYYRQRYHGSSSSGYTSGPEATCSLKIKENGRLEVLKIPCEIVSTFTEGSKSSPPSQNVMNTTVCVTNTTVVNKTLPANAPSVNFTMAPNGTLIPSVGWSNLTMNGTVVPINATANNATISSNVTVINSTSCTTTVMEKDPLTVKGPPIDPSKMECIVDIKTKDAYFTKNVDCQTLLNYSKMPVPKNQGSSIVPSRDKLKSWVSSPPWWLSLFVIG